MWLIYCRTLKQKMSLVVGVTGKKRAGKDTVAAILSDALKKDSVLIVNFADPLKGACAALFDLSEQQLYGAAKETVDARWGVTPRRVLQFVGTDIVRRHMPDLLPHIEESFWVHCMRLRIQRAADAGLYRVIVVPDVRFMDEAALIKELGGVIVRVTRKDCQNADNHVSEMEMDTIEADYTIVNDGTLADLRGAVQTMGWPDGTKGQCLMAEQ